MVDIAIVGAGPAGMAAAVAAVEAGCSVMVIDEGPREGGQIYRQPLLGIDVPPVGTKQERARKSSLLARFAMIRDRIDFRSRTVAHSLFPGPEVQIADEATSRRVQPAAVIVATGVSERAVPIPGWTLPGVMYAGAAQALFKSTGTAIGKRVLIAGAGALPVVVGAQLAANGVGVAAVVLLHPLRAMGADPVGLFRGRHVVREGLQYRRALKAKGVPILEGWAPVKLEGDDRVRSVTIAPVDARGRFRELARRTFEVDAVCLNFGFTANSELVRMAEADCYHDPLRGGWLPVRDDVGKTSVPGIYVAGDGAALRGALVAEAEGHVVGASAAAEVLKRPVSDLSRFRRAIERNERFQVAFRRTLHLPDGVWKWASDATVACRCENITVGRIRRAISEGHVTLDAIKRNTRCGMGLCGGRTCLQSVTGYVKAEGREITKPMRARPVARPVKLGALADLREPGD